MSKRDESPGEPEAVHTGAWNEQNNKAAPDELGPKLRPAASWRSMWGSHWLSSTARPGTGRPARMMPLMWWSVTLEP